ncbi:hypothetical protein ABPG72_005235 [Tetrahymena utriculariae]
MMFPIEKQNSQENTSLENSYSSLENQEISQQQFTRYKNIEINSEINTDFQEKVKENENRKKEYYLKKILVPDSMRFNNYTQFSDYMIRLIDHNCNDQLGNIESLNSEVNTNFQNKVEENKEIHENNQLRKTKQLGNNQNSNSEKNTDAQEKVEENKEKLKNNQLRVNQNLLINIGGKQQQQYLKKILCKFSKMFIYQ